ncbi:MAG: pyridoxal 5'-phosphate synthase [Balneola sp.]
MNPFSKFEDWYKEELFKTSVSIPSACCLSTTGLDGYPNARFLSLKSVQRDSFIITGPTKSRKGLELKENPKAALTFWWTETERQVRIQGDVHPLEEELADIYFNERNRDAQLISLLFDQGEQVDKSDSLEQKFRTAKKELEGQEIERPSNWGGFRIVPVRIEFLEFDSSRLHKRTLFTKTESDWKAVFLRP